VYASKAADISDVVVLEQLLKRRSRAQRRRRARDGEASRRP